MVSRFSCSSTFFDCRNGGCTFEVKRIRSPSPPSRSFGWHTEIEPIPVCAFGCLPATDDTPPAMRILKLGVRCETHLYLGLDHLLRRPPSSRPQHLERNRPVRAR